MAWLGPALCAAAYLLGSISFALIIARRYGVELHEVGSGNPGATNAGRALGKRVGYVVLLLDALKGLGPTLAARHLLGVDAMWTAATGTAAALGHVYPLWFRFRGGKGAATGAGVLLAVEPLAGVAASLGYLVLKKITRRASGGSLAGSAAGMVVVAVLWDPSSWPFRLALALTALILWRHRDNIVRLARGQEPES